MIEDEPVSDHDRPAAPVSAHSEVSDLVTQRARGRHNTEAWRARRRRGLVCRTIRLTRGELNRFVVAGYLDPATVGDARAEAAAVEAFIADYLP